MVALTLIPGKGDGVGDFRGYVGEEPPLPDNIVTVLTNRDGPPIPVANQSLPVYEFNSITIRVRGKDYTTAYTKAKDIFKQFQNLPSFVNSEGVEYSGILASSSVWEMPRDESERWIFACDYQPVRRDPT